MCFVYRGTSACICKKIFFLTRQDLSATQEYICQNSCTHVYALFCPVRNDYCYVSLHWHLAGGMKIGVQGYGTLLMEEAERIARREHRSLKLAVISGVGTRHYYRKLGYHLEGHYMVKHLK